MTSFRTSYSSIIITFCILHPILYVFPKYKRDKKKKFIVDLIWHTKQQKSSLQVEMVAVVSYF